MGQEIVIFRENMMGKLMRNLVGVKPDLESADLKRYVSVLRVTFSDYSLCLARTDFD